MLKCDNFAWADDMSFLRYPALIWAKMLLSLRTRVKARWDDTHDSMEGFVWGARAFHLLHLALFSSIAGLIVAGFISLFLNFYFSNLIFAMVCMMMALTLGFTGAARSPLPLDIWLDRKNCNRMGIQYRNQIETAFFDVLLQAVPRSESKMLGKRQRLMREPAACQFILWSISPEVGRDLEARVMHASSNKPTLAAPRPRL